MLKEIQTCFKTGKVLYTKHARDEMDGEEFGEIKEKEVSEAVLHCKILENYQEDSPYPSCLIYGRTLENRPIHIVCAYAKDIETAIIITAYQPHPERWIDFERRRV